jgi:CheY-like chemotaxis protein
MPGLDGLRLAALLAEQRPELPIVLISGNRIPSENFAASPLRAFVPKPLSQDKLTHAIARVLQTPASHPPHGA